MLRKTGFDDQIFLFNIKKIMEDVKALQFDISHKPFIAF